MIGDPILFYTRSLNIEVTRVRVLEVGRESVERDHWGVCINYICLEVDNVWWSFKFCCEKF